MEKNSQGISEVSGVAQKSEVYTGVPMEIDHAVTGIVQFMTLKNEKHLKNEQKVGMLLQKRTDTRGVYRDKYYEEISLSLYIYIYHPYNHTH